MNLDLAVNDETWGLFAPPEVTDTDDPEVDVEGWWLSQSESQAMVVATLGLEAGSAADELEQVADWVALLHRRLAPGGHVAEVKQLQLSNADDTTATVSARMLQPFTIAPGDSTAFVGEVVFEVASLGEGS